MMNLHTEAQEIAREAIEEVGAHDRDAIEQFIWESCNGHQISIMYHSGIAFCAEQDTSKGEDFIVSAYGSIAQGGDCFGAIACKIAFYTLFVATMEALDQILEEKAASFMENEQ